MDVASPAKYASTRKTHDGGSVDEDLEADGAAAVVAVEGSGQWRTRRRKRLSRGPCPPLRGEPLLLLLPPDPLEGELRAAELVDTSSLSGVDLL